MAVRSEGPVEPAAESAVARSAESEPDAPPPVELKGRSDARPAAEPGTAPAPGDAPPPVGERYVISDRGAEELTKVLEELSRPDPLELPRFPERPGRPDLALGDPHRAPRYRRLDLLGRRVDGLGPWLPDGRELAFTGVAQVDHEDAGEAVEPEVEEPLVTAVVGKVVSGGEPIAGAEVILYSTFYQRHARYDHHVREVGRMVTDGYGVFDLRPVGLDTVHFGSNGEVLLNVRKQGFGSIVGMRLDNIQPEIENDLGTFEISREFATLVGVVTDLQGKPVEGAAVRVSGSVNPVLYDKTERMIILKDCPTAVTDADGAYRLEAFATDDQHLSIHVNIDCTQHFQSHWPAGEHRYDTRVQAGNSIRGRVVDAAGDPVAAAVISCGDNWTPSNPDGTFWLDNIVSGPADLLIAHHRYASVRREKVALETEDLEIVMTAALPRVELVVVAEETGVAVPLITLDWRWANGRPPHQFFPTSRNWHAADGRYDVVVPEGAVGAVVGAQGRAFVPLDAAALEDGHVNEVALPAAE